MSQGSSESKNELPTARRLRDARKRGQVAKSTELSGALSLLCGLLCVISLAPWAAQRISQFSILMTRSLETVEIGAVQVVVVQAIILIAQLSLIPLGLTAVVYLMSLWLQTGTIFSLDLVKPRLERLNPVAGAKRLFSIRSMVQFIFMLIKGSIIAAASALVCMNVLGDAVRVIHADAGAALTVANTALMNLLMWCGGMFVLLGMLDLVYQRWQHIRDLRMSTSEVKREQRDDQGNGELKSQRKHFANELLPREQLAYVPMSSLIVADSGGRVLALVYRPKQFPLPLYLVRGNAEFGEEILSIAQQHHIPTVLDDSLTAVLYPGAQPGISISPKHLDTVLTYISQAAAAQAQAQAMASSPASNPS